MRSFKLVFYLCAILCSLTSSLLISDGVQAEHTFNGPYTGRNVDHIAFPIGGIGSGMYCLEGTGAINHMSIRHQMEYFQEPCCFTAVCVKSHGKKIARILEGPVPDWKIFEQPNAGTGSTGKTYGLPRFRECEFRARFPFAEIRLTDSALPLTVALTGWSPFIPGDADNSSWPAGALEYRLTNTSNEEIEVVFSFHSKNFLGRGSIETIDHGFRLVQADASFAFSTPFEKETAVDYCWFRGGWRDSLTVTWNNVVEGAVIDNPPDGRPAPGASLYVPITLMPGAERVIRLVTTWYVPTSSLSFGTDTKETAATSESTENVSSEKRPTTYRPWYAEHFDSLERVTKLFVTSYDLLRKKSEEFAARFDAPRIPPEIVEAVTANLTILKSPTILRQHDGRIWGWEGSQDFGGSCPGSCTHVWNYAQSLCRLFPDLERSLRRTEFFESQLKDGRQAFRANLPIRPGGIEWDASDGLLGGIMKVHREWVLSDDKAFLTEFWPRVKSAMEWAIRTWDPNETGLLEKPHHNTYDINYQGPEGHCGSFYLGALAAMVRMAEAMGEDSARWSELGAKGRKRMENELFNGRWFIQKVPTPGAEARIEDQSSYYKKIAERVNAQGPKYQYGTGCLSDGVLGFWMARCCGIDEDLVDPKMIESHLLSVYRYNFVRDLSGHANPQRPSYAIGSEGGLLVCSWPDGNKPLLPFPYSDEVFTGVEYQIASHLIMIGHTKEGLDIVRTCRARYDGTRRNPFNEYECGHWYARAMSSFALLDPSFFKPKKMKDRD